MNLFDRFLSWFEGDYRDAGVALQRRASAGYGFTLPTSQVDNPRWLDQNIGEYRKAYASSVAVYACVLARAKGVSAATLRVYQEVGGNREEVPDHPLRQLMSNPNPEMSEAEFLVMTQTLMDATGFAAIQKVRAQAGNVAQLWHLRSDWLKEIRHAQQPSDWDYHIPGIPKPVRIEAPDILIIPGGPATDLNTTGLSPIAVALREVGIDSSMTDFLKLFIDNGAAPRHAITMEREVQTQTEADEIKARFQSAYGGYRAWTRVALLTGGMKIEKIGSDMDELAYPQLRFLTEAHICAVFGVPPIVANMQVGLDAATYSNYAQARRAFFEDTIAALWQRHDGAFTRGLLRDFSDDASLTLEFDVSAVPAFQEDAGIVWERSRAAASSGLITVNQFQSAVGLPGLGDPGDVLLLPMSVMPTRPEDLAILADQTAAPPEPVPAALQGGEDDSEDDESVDQDSEDAAASRAIERPGASVRLGVANGGITLVPLATRNRITAANRRQINKLTATHAARFRAMWKRQGDLVADAWSKRGAELGEATRKGETAEQWAAAMGLRATRSLEDIPWTEMDEESRRELAALHLSGNTAAWGAAATALDVPLDFTLNNPYVKYTLGRLAKRITGINSTTRNDVRRVVTSGLDEGLGIEVIANNLRGLFQETYRNRALTVARTESQLSYNLATADAYRASKIVTGMTLFDNPNHIEDYGAIDGLSCAQRNGVITDVDSVQLHIEAEHPNGTLAVSPLLVRPLGE